MMLFATYTSGNSPRLQLNVSPHIFCQVEPPPSSQKESACREESSLNILVQVKAHSHIEISFKII